MAAVLLREGTLAAPRPRTRRLPRAFASSRLVAGATVCGLLAVVALAAPWLAPQDPLATNLKATLAEPSAAHLLGTDQYGRDVLSRLIWGTRVSAIVAAGVVVIALVLGTAVGVTSGYFGRRVDFTVTFFNDILLAFPGFLLALALVAARGSTLENVVVAIGIAYAPRVAVVMRSIVLTIRSRPFVEAAAALGLGSWPIIWRHVLPNSLPPVVVVATLSAATAILAEAGLSFLGIGVQPPTPTWGNVIAEGREFLRSSPWISVAGGAFTAVGVIALNLMGDGLRDTLDPQLRGQVGPKQL